MPVQTKFVEAVYPKEAEDQGLAAVVVLFLTIDKTGKVTKADVAEPAGHGFDEAAQAAALGFEFQPATRDGKPFAVRIPYKYNFTLKEVPKPASELPKPTTGNLSGIVRISSVEQPLAGAEIVATGPDGAEHRTTADETGKWSIDGLPPGTYKVHVGAPGFSPLDSSEDVAVGESTELTYRLGAEVKGSVEVVVRGERPPREVTRRTIERREMTRIPGTSGDALRSIQSLPGVARPPGLAGLLIVRGSSPNDSAYFIDGASVPLIYHFGGLSSAVPSELLERIDFYPGNFSSRFGTVMGGIVDVGLREPDTHCTGDYGKAIEGKTGCFHGFVDLNLIDTRAMVQGKVGEWSFVVAGRRSWFDTWLKPALEAADAGVTSAPVYYDYQAIAETHPTKSSRLSLRFFGSDDKFKALISDPIANDPGFGGSLTFGTSFYRGQALYETDLSPSVDLRSMIAAGDNVVDFGLGPFKFQLDWTIISVRNELSFKILRGLKLHTGMDFLTGPYHVFIRLPPPPRPGEATPGPFVTQPLQQVDENGMVWRPAWYAEAEVAPEKRLLIVPGFRVDYARDSGHTDLSPRLNARYDLIGGKAEEDRPIEERSLRTTLKGGAGFFYQPPQFPETNAVFGTPGLYSNKSIHYSVGVEQELNRHVEVSLEGYYKDLTKQVSRAESLGATFAYSNQGTGSIIGLETLVKYKPDDRFFGWLAYTLSRSVRVDRPGQPEHLFQYDQTHNLTVLGSYRLGRGWEFGARFRLISGNLDTPVARPPALTALYAADAAAYTPIQGKPFSTRLPVFHQLDLRVDKAWQFKSWRLSAYLDVQNVYDYAAREAVAYNYDYTKTSYQTGLPIIPSLGIRGEI